MRAYLGVACRPLDVLLEDVWKGIEENSLSWGHAACKAGDMKGARSRNMPDLAPS